MDVIDEDVQHAAYGEELSFYRQVQCGNVAETERQCCSRPVSYMASLARLSADSVRNITYHLVVTAALVTRFCIEGGMAQETAYSLSDIYIRRADLCSSAAELDALHMELCTDFARRMKLLDRSVFPPAVSRCIDFMLANLRSPFTIEDAAAAADVHPKYLSAVFRKATGRTPAAFIREHRIEEAKDMLSHSGMSYASIASALCFSTQSHFCAVFKKMTGMTPAGYRSEYYQTHWRMRELSNHTDVLCKNKRNVYTE